MGHRPHIKDDTVSIFYAVEWCGRGVVILEDIQHIPMDIVCVFGRGV